MPAVTNLHHAPARVKIRGILGEGNLTVCEGPRDAALRLPSAVLRRLVALPTLILVLAVACMGGDEAAFEASQLEQIVLRPADLPSPRSWVRFDEGRQGSADQPAGDRADPTRFGRIDGWKARYRREGAGPRTAGPLVVESRADVFESEGGAEDELAAHRTDLGEGWRPLDDPELGDEGLAATLTQGNVRFYVVGWRFENATASINANGFELSLEDALGLARKQQRRIEAEA
jgi:hypothetical protein